jgi:hypothetical protein
MVLDADRLVADLLAPEIAHGVQQDFWRIESRDGMRIYVRLFASDGAPYLMELECTGYGDEPIAGRFVNDKFECVASAWPRGGGAFVQWVKFDPGNLFICWTEDRLGIAHHQEWRALQAWKKHSNQLYAYLDFVRKLLHVPSFGYCPKA